MSRILDPTRQNDIKVDIMALMDDLGYEPEEVIPGLVAAIYAAADQTRDLEQALDEAANMLVDGVDQ